MASKHLYATKISANDSTAREQLGIVRREWSSTDSCFKTYKYVQASLTTAASNGICLNFADTKGKVVQDLKSATKVNIPAGVAIGTLTDDYYGWIQIGGLHTAVDTAGYADIVAGDFIHLEADTNAVCVRAASGVASSVKILGVAVKAETSSTVAAMLDCRYGDVIAGKHAFNTPLTSNSATKKEELGTIRKEWSDTDSCLKTYRYVQASLTATGYSGVPTLYYDVLGHVVTDDISQTKQGIPAGIVIGALTNTYYGWIQIGGFCDSIRTDDTAITEGETIIFDTTDRMTDAVAVATPTTHKPLGIGVATVSATTTSGLLCCDYGDTTQ